MAEVTDVCNSELEDDEATAKDEWYLLSNLPVVKLCSLLKF